MLDTRPSIQNRNAQTIVIINLLILCLLFMSGHYGAVVFFVALGIVLFLSIQSIAHPTRAIYLFFGIKVMFDTLWFLKYRIQFIASLGVLELYIVSAIPIVLSGSRIKGRRNKNILLVISLYIAWALGAMVVNQGQIDWNALVRQMGMLIGLLVGMKYIESLKQFDLLVYCVFLSTLVPVAASLVQLVPAFSELPIFHYKMDYSGAIRYSGLYYDPGTTGMVNTISFLCCVYLASSASRLGVRRNYYVYFIPVNLLVILAGGTRSVIVAALVIFGFYLINQGSKRARVFLVLASLILLWVSSPFLERILERSRKDIVTQAKFDEMFQETDTRTMFTGRMGIWQDILAELETRSVFQQLFGTGLSSNAHSTYFFLILQIGWLGMLFLSGILVHLVFRLWIIKHVGLPKVAALFGLIAFMIIGFSLTTVMFTSFQWITFLLVGSILSLSYHEQVVRRQAEMVGA